MGIDSIKLAEAIIVELARTKRTVKGLSEATGIPNSTLDRKLKHPQRWPLTVVDLGDIAAALQKSPLELLSQALSDAGKSREPQTLAA
ncbi:hypothetical protein M3B43_06730 [Nesterenkonia massiliensis]|uniref:HTH cro/C1-type domain-containing protein n=1 Tax=Nesterenkonia massiliensis TaxID=1232429 RepID=A0ABT2HQQ8_9MICC|nr:hypothetical protein [Nesterenkonia massiliensis]MCT1607027.1 hypothetical protein [Nesterenkonia massiliensis]